MTHGKPLLLTGAAGDLAMWLRPRLREHYRLVRCSDIRDVGPAAPGEEIVLGDLADASAVDRMVRGVDTIVHFGAIVDETSFEPILRNNILGTYNVFEAARRHGVSRIVFASSNHATGFYPVGETIDAKFPPRPDSLYGVSKAFGEDLASLYVNKYGMEIACLRIGSVLAKPIEPRHLSTWLSYEDLLRLVLACLTAPRLGLTIVFGVSNNERRWWDNRQAGHIGYKPQDNAERYASDILSNSAKDDPEDPAIKYQGGNYAAQGFLQRS